MAIRHTKVLLVRNSNPAFAALSQAVGDWYAQARGLNGPGGAADHYWMSFDFGPGTEQLCTRMFSDYVGVPNPNFNNLITGAGNNLPLRILDNGSVTCVDHSAKLASNLRGMALGPALSQAYMGNDIECVLVLPGVPGEVVGPFNHGNFGGTGLAFAQDTELLLAIAAQPGVASGPLRAWPNDAYGRLNTFNLLGQGQWRSATTRPGPAKPLRGLRFQRGMPCGRVGWSDNRTQYSSLAQVQAMVNNALACEATNNLNKPLLTGGTAYIFGGGVVNQVAANYAARDLGVTNLGYVTGHPGGNGDGEQALWAQRPALAGVPMARVMQPNVGDMIEAQAGGLLQVWGAMLSRVAPNYQLPLDMNSLSFLPGGWAHSWTSSSNAMRDFALLQGASLAFGNAGEPFATNLADVDCLLLALLHGYCGAEAARRATNNTVGGTGFQTGSNAYTNAWGDPLYAPYRATPLLQMQAGG